MDSNIIKFEESCTKKVAKELKELYNLNERDGLIDFIFIEIGKAFSDKCLFSGSINLTWYISKNYKYCKTMDISQFMNDMQNEISYRLNLLAQFFVDMNIAGAYEICESDNGDTKTTVNIYDTRGEAIINISMDWNPVNIEHPKFYVCNYDIMHENVEHVLARKIISLFSNKEDILAQDFYDVFVILRMFRVDINLVHEHIKECNLVFNSDLLYWPVYDKTLNDIKDAYDYLWISSIYTGVYNVLKPDFKSVIELVSKFYKRLMHSSGKDNKECIWIP